MGNRSVSNCSTSLFVSNREEAWRNTETISNINESVFLKYIIKEGNNMGYDVFKYKKRVDSLNLFDFIKPHEYNLFKINIEEPTEEEKNIINNGYIRTIHSWNFNNKLRTGQKLSNSEERLYNILKRLCHNNRCGKNCILRRYVKLDYLKQFNINFNRAFTKFTSNDLLLIRTTLIYSRIIVEKGFMSASYGKSVFFGREILLLLYWPFGIRMYVTDNDEETEVILSNEMKYVCFDCYLEESKLVICCYLYGSL